MKNTFRVMVLIGIAATVLLAVVFIHPQLCRKCNPLKSKRPAIDIVDDYNNLFSKKISHSLKTNNYA